MTANVAARSVGSTLTFTNAPPSSSASCACPCQVLLFFRWRERLRSMSVFRNQFRRGLGLLSDRRLDRFEPDDQAQRMGRELERGRRQVTGRQFQGEQAEIGGARQVNDQRPRRCGERIQLERRCHDDAEAAERSCQQPRQIVTGDVLDDDPAALGKTSVRSRELDADDQVAWRSVSMPPRSAVVSGNDAADCGAICPMEDRAESTGGASRAPGSRPGASLRPGLSPSSRHGGAQRQR